MAKLVDVHNLSGRLAELVDCARHGEEVTISDAGQPIAKIVPIEPAHGARGFGLFKGQIWMSDDFSAPLSEDELREWEK